MQCPYCAEDIKDAAIVCKHCKRELDDAVSKEKVVTVKPEGHSVKRIMSVLKIFLIAVIFLVLVAAYPELVVILLLLLCLFSVWLLPRKQGKISLERIKNYKQHKFRIALSIPLVLLIIVMAFAWHGRSTATHYPEPQIIITSERGPQGENKSYTLTLNTTDATEVLVNGQEAIISDTGAVEHVVELTRAKMSINILASNKYKETEKKLVVKRDETPAEVQAREAKEERQRIAAEQRKQEAAEKRAKRAAEQKAQQIENLNKEIEALRQNKLIANYDSINVILVQKALFYAWGKQVLKAEMHEDQEVRSLGAQLKNLVSKYQQREFPNMRKAYAEIIAKELWLDNIEVKTSGGVHSVITFIGGPFANNRYAAETHAALKQVLIDLRFDRVNYKWIPNASNYNTTVLESERDGELVLK